MWSNLGNKNFFLKISKKSQFIVVVVIKRLPKPGFVLSILEINESQT